MTPLEPAVAVVTGMGAVTAAGIGVGRLWDAIRAGVPLDRPVADWDTEGFRCARAVQLPREVRRRMRDAAPDGTDDTTALALLALQEAVEDAGRPSLGGPRVGLYLGTSTGGLARWVDYHRARVEGQPPPWGPRHTGYDGTAQRIARELGIHGPAITVSNACCSSTAAMGLALDDLRDAVVDVAVVLGSDTINRFAHAGFDLLGALTAGRMNPFGEGRSGLLLGEGAAALVLERLEHARARGVVPRAAVAGAGWSGDANHMTGPDREGRGVERAVRMALDDAGLSADDVDLVSAHATSTLYNDAMEARALHRVFGHLRPPIAAVGYKAVLGHTLGACGAIEVVLCVRSMETGLIPPSTGEGPQDPDCPLPLLRDATLRQPVRVAVSTNSAFAGNNATVALAAPPEGGW